MWIFHKKSSCISKANCLHQNQRACNKEEHYALAILYTIFGNSNRKGYQEKSQLLFTVCDQFISKHLREISQ